jgi:DNA polymerase I
MTEAAWVVRDEAGLHEAVRRLVERPILACDLETTGLDPHRDTVLLVQLGDDRLQVAVDARALEDLSPLRAVLERQGLTVFHNAQFDLKFLKGLGLEVSRPQDTMLLEILLAGGRKVGPRTLKACCERRVGLTLDKAERTSFMNYEGALTDAQIAYGLADVLATFHLFLAQSAAIEAAGLARVAQIEGAATDAFADLEYRGFHLDRPAWEAVLGEARAARDEARKALQDAAAPVAPPDLFGHVDVNFDSESDVRDVFTRLGYDALPDLTKATLARVDHPFAEALLAYREHQHVLSSYGEGFLSHLHPVTGRLHPRFKQIGASTGRSACEAPNLQSIRRGDRFRRAFKAPAGRCMVTADYATAELRILAELSGDPVFVKTFEEGGDLHAIVAEAMFKKTVSKTENPALRERAKAINFGLCYGMGAAGLARQLDCPVEEAEALLARWFATYPKVRTWLEETSEAALAEGRCQTLAGRRLHLEGADDPERRAQLIRQAKNMPIQGTSADILKLAMARLVRALRRESLDAFLVNCVHDELVVEASADDGDRVAEVMRREMVAAGEAFLRRVPTVVDVQVGDHWAK